MTQKLFPNKSGRRIARPPPALNQPRITQATVVLPVYPRRCDSRANAVADAQEDVSNAVNATWPDAVHIPPANQ